MGIKLASHAYDQKKRTDRSLLPTNIAQKRSCPSFWSQLAHHDRAGQEIPCRAFSALHDRSNRSAGSETPDRTPGCHADPTPADTVRSRSSFGNQLEKVPQVGGKQSSRYRRARGAAGSSRVCAAQVLDPDEVLPRVVVGRPRQYKHVHRCLPSFPF
jgi:hypothetical protein